MSMKMELSKAKEIANHIMDENPAKLAEFLTKELEKNGVGCFIYRGDDYLEAYVQNLDGAIFLKRLVEK